MLMMSHRLKILFLICFLLPVTSYAASQVGPASKPDHATNALNPAAPEIVIGPGDELQIAVYDVKSLSGTVRVSQNGNVNLPLIGKTHLAGLTAEEAANRIQEKLKTGGFVLYPQVSVAISQYATQGADVMGQVRNPGIYPTLGSRTLLNMLTLAGGVTRSAGKLVTIIHKDDPHHPVYLALAQNAAGLKLQANPIIQPGDTIIVQKSGIVYILGDVKRPGGYLLDNNERLTLMEAISLAGGNTVTSNLKNARLIRKLPAGREEIKLNLKKVYRGKEADLKVKNGDILYIPSSAVKTFVYHGFAGIATTANTAVYAAHY